MNLNQPITFAKGRFHVQRELGRGGMGIVYEARDTERNMQVALKTLLHLDLDNLYYFKKEFRALHDLVHPNLCSFIDLIEDEGIWLLTMELIEGIDFFSYVNRAGRLSGAPLAITSCGLKTRGAKARIEQQSDDDDGNIAVRTYFDEKKLRQSLAGLCQGLHALHKVGKIHRDVKPSNVLITEDDRVILLDFGLIADVGMAQHSGDSNIVGTAAYMAPEQIDSESVGPEADWYSVGVMLYEALTGSLPFAGTALQIIMDKQMSKPVKPSTIKSPIPEDLEMLCMGLLHREPKDRPSAASILKIARVSSPIPIVSASTELTAHTWGQRFVGRTEELAILNNAYQTTTADSRFESVLIEGVSGVGKSTLLENFTTSVSTSHPSTLILKGRCYERESAPYKAFDGVIESLIRHTRGMTDEETGQLKPNNARLLVHLFPALKRSPIFATVPTGPTEIRDPHELQNRAFEALKELISLLSHHNPLIVIMDDMQWADADSLSLLKHLVRFSDSSRLLLIVLSRLAKNSETSFLNWKDVFSSNYRHIRLGPLSRTDAQALAYQFINQNNLAYRLDAQLVASEADGHPLYIAELVRHAALGANEWQNLKLDEVIWNRVNTLPLVAKSILETICVAGTPISKKNLQGLTDHLPEEFSKSLLLLRANNLMRSHGPRSRDTVEPYHDRVREAVVAYLDENAHLKEMQLKIGRFFLKIYSETDLDENIFDIVQHLDAGKNLITDKAEILRLAELYFLAGKKARLAAAYVASLSFFKNSLELFPVESWTTRYETMFDMYASAAETAYIVGDFSFTNTLVKTALKKARSDLDKAKIYETYILSLQANDKHLEALDEAVAMVRKLGVRIPRRPGTLYVLINTLKTIFRLRGKKEDEIIGLPHTTNSKISAAMRLMAIMSHAAFFYLPNLWVTLFLISLKLSVKYGIDKVCSVVFIGWGVMNCAVLKRYDEGYKYGSISLKLLTHFKQRYREEMVLFVFATFVQHWKEHLRLTLPYLQKSYQIADRTGSLPYMAHSGANYCYHGFFIGLFLPDLAKKSSFNAEVMIHKSQILPYNTNQIFYQTILNLLEKSPKKSAAVSLAGDAYDYKKMVPQHLDEGHNVNLFDYYLCSLILCVLFGSHRRAYEMSLAAGKYAKDVKGTYAFGVYPFYASIAYLKFYGEADRSTKRKLLRQVSKNLKFIKKLSEHSKENHLHKYTLVEAELARVREKTDLASSLYERAIQGAIEHKFPNDAAWASELAADYFRELGESRKAKSYARKAIAHYEEWGAFAKVDDIQNKYYLSE